MFPGKNTIILWVVVVLAHAPASAAWAEEPPGLLPPEASSALANGARGQAAPTERSDGPAFSVVRFAGGTVEFAVPLGWGVKQVPLSREIRIVAGPGDVPDDPSRLESGLWLAYERASPALMGSPLVRPALDWELRARLPKGAGPDARLIGPPQAVKVGGHAGLKQTLELAAIDAGLTRRASYIVAQTPWGFVEIMAIAPLFAEGNASARLGGIVSSLAFFAPQPTPAISRPDIQDARLALGSWKGQKGSLHLLPDGRVRMEFDAVRTLTGPCGSSDQLRGRVSSGSEQHESSSRRGAAACQPTPESIEGLFTAHGDLLLITWNDGGKLNYRWRLDHDELQLRDHEGKFSRLRRMFEAPPTATGAPLDKVDAASAPRSIR